MRVAYATTVDSANSPPEEAVEGRGGILREKREKELLGGQKGEGGALRLRMTWISLSTKMTSHRGKLKVKGSGVKLT